MLNYLPNALTILRLLLTVPLGILIVQEEFGLALCIGFLAGLSDALDGFVARQLNAYSQLGAALDPIADKILITVCFLSFANVGLIPWYVAITVISRDLIIVCGAISYRLLIGPFEFGARPLSKANMLVQISFCVLVLAAQLVPHLLQSAVWPLTVLVLFITVASGLDYVISWSMKAARLETNGEREQL